ncbi:MAG: hypothetical protein ABIP30_00715 [Ferruginibacter sp.]
MNWKIFTAAFVSILSTAIPQNIIGCGPDQDPYDYYTSFFSQNVASTKTYSPFYYSNNLFLYSDDDPVNKSVVLADEWAAYCGTPVKSEDAFDFVNQYDLKDVNNLYYNIEKAQPLKIPDSLKRNSMTNYFLQKKDLEALGYIIYAKKIEPDVTGDSRAWEPIKRDSVEMAKFIKDGKQLYAAAKSDLFKLKYAYQVIRLAHYSGNYADAIKLYDDYIPQNKTESVLKTMCLSLKAGAYYHTGQAKEAAYLFSKAFSENDVNRVSNYISFNWSVDSKAEKDTYLSQCKTKIEKANMLALFALGSTADEISTMQEIYKLNPSAPVLEVLAVREINKQEEGYLTPDLNKQKGGKQFFYTWNESQNVDSVSNGYRQRIKEMANFFNSIAQKNNSSNSGLFETGAAYCASMIKDYPAAHTYITAAEKLKLSNKVKDQLELTKLLVTINKTNKIDVAFEDQILPSLKWLQNKADTDPAVNNEYNDNSEWKLFYRNLMSQVVAKRYHEQGDIYKEVLAIGAADRIFGTVNNYYSNAIEYLHNNLESKDVEQLYALMNNKNKTGYEKYIVAFNSLNKNDVTDFAGTAYLRDYNYTSAITWLKKNPAGNSYAIPKNPFIELLYDQEEANKGEKKIGSKLAFATEMARLEKLTQTDKINVAKNYYKMALGMYNMTYYGHTWELVQYYRGGSDGYYIPVGANNFQKEYYGCYKAHDYFKKAMDASTDKNFKAKCLFMMAKCAQKQVRQPQYGDFPGNYDQYDVARKAYFSKFKNNKYFPQFVKEYKNTAFYQDAYSSCSYLSDFIDKK